MIFPSTLSKTKYFLGAFLENYEKRLLASSCLSVRSHGKSRPPLVSFPWNMMFKDFSQICRENTIFIKIWPEYLLLYIKTSTCLWKYLTDFFLEWEKDCRENQNQYCIFNKFFPPNLWFLWDSVVKFGRHGLATDDNIIRRILLAC